MRMEAAVEVPAVSATGIAMRFGDVVAVEDASFDLERGRFLTVLGPSGSGKTTLLRIVAGFLQPTRGRVAVAGRDVNAVPAHRRSIGMVFQRLALFPHMTAGQNVAFPLRMRRFDARAIPARVAEFLDLVRLGGYGDRRIGELSGGQQQRVAIARALVFEPDLLLLDEPLAALDRRLREEMQLEFRRIQRELGVTTINVTHDQREALVVSDRIIVMDRGRIRQDASPAELYRRPANPFVAGFVGVTNPLDGTLVSRAGEAVRVRIGDLETPGTAAGALANGPVRCALRAERVRIAVDAAALKGMDAMVAGTVADVIFEGERLLYEVHVARLGEAPVRVLHHDGEGAAPHEVGAPVHLGWRARDLHVFPGEPAPPSPEPPTRRDP